MSISESLRVVQIRPDMPNRGGGAFQKTRRTVVLFVAFFLIATSSALTSTSAQAEVISVQRNSVGTEPGHDYGMSALRDGAVERRFWCGVDTSTGQIRESIFYSDVNTSTGAVTARRLTLPPEPGNWDKYLVCDPSALKGTFTYAGSNWTYALYYTSNQCANNGGRHNAIGVAFSNNLINWVRTPQPVVKPEVGGTTFTCSDTIPYGAGGQSVTRTADGSIKMFYGDNSSGTEKTLVRTSTDGYNFGPASQVSTTGLPNQLWDVAYEPSLNRFYAASRAAEAARVGSETGAVDISYISAANITTGSWTIIGQVNTDLTLTSLNHNPGILRDINGRLSTLPAIQVFVSQTPLWQLDNTDIEQTSIGYVTVTEGTSVIRRYKLQSGPGWFTSASPTAPPGYGYDNQAYRVTSTPASDRSALYSCRIASTGSTDFFSSKSPTCEGQYQLGRVGYVYNSASAAANLQPLYRCYTSGRHLTTISPTCEGTGTPEMLLGYVTQA